MSAQPTGRPDGSAPYEVIHLGAETLEEAEIEVSLASHRAWVEAGRPGAVSHDEAMRELLGGR
jgi:hypothetical protein